VIAGAGDHAERRGERLACGADRERAIESLKAAYVYGLVTKDEFDERVYRTLASRTHEDLALLTADIPAGLAALPAALSPAPAIATPETCADLGLGERAVVVPAALAGLALGIAAFGGDSVAGQVALGAAGECALLSLVFLAVALILGSRRTKRSGGRSPRPRLSTQPKGRTPPPLR
jgi:hypothetical protein